jgi:hypothetical protein
MSERIATYAEFWPFYLREHSKAVTRWLHFVGTSLGLGIAALAVRSGQGSLIPAALVCSYGMAWAGHFGIEKNRPATFKYPLWSFVSDFRMLGLMAVGQLGPHLARAQAGASGAQAPAAPAGSKAV